MPVSAESPAQRKFDLHLTLPFENHPTPTVQIPCTIDVTCIYSSASARSPTLLVALPVPKPITGDLSTPTRFSASAFTFTATHSTTSSHLPHPIHLNTPTSHPYSHTNLTRWWRAHARHLTDRLNTSPVLAAPPLDLLLPTPFFSSTYPVPLPHLLARPILWPTGSLAHAARYIQLLPLAHPPSSSSHPSHMLAPHAALQTASVTSDLDRAVLLTCIARGMRYRAAIVIGAGTLGTRLGVAVYDTDDNKRPSVYELPVPPLDQHWRPVIADAVGFSVAVAVTPTGVYANESGMAGSKCDWRLETWRRLGPQANVDTMLEPDRGHTLTAAWVKSASPVRVESVAESPLWANQIHMFGPRAGSSVCDMSPRVAETQVAQAIQAWLVEQRGYLELDTTWDPELAHVLGQHLRARASGDASGSPGGGHAFDLTRVIRRTIPCGWMFRGAPHTTVTCPLGTHKLAVEVLVRRVMGEWARYAPAQAMVWEADTRARWAVAVVLEDAVGEGMDGGVFGCWVMVGVALPEAAEGESESTTVTSYDDDDCDDGEAEQGTQTSVVVMGETPAGHAI